MNVKTVSMLAATLATAFIALSVPATFAQRGRGNGAPAAPRGNGTPGAQRPNGTFVGAPQRPTAPAAPRVIQPISNPIMPMGNPVPPMLPTPFIRYSERPATVVHPGQGRGNRGGRGDYGNNDGHGERGNGRGRGYAPVIPTYYYPPSYYGYPSLYYDYYPGLEPEPVIPGQLPGSRYYQYPDQTNVDSAPNDVYEIPSPPVPQPQNEYYSEPRLIINEPRLNRVIVPPAIGTPRSEVIAQFGQPWGSFTVRGEETLYFEGLTVVIGADGRVIRTR